MSLLINLLHPCWKKTINCFQKNDPAIVIFLIMVDMRCWGKRSLGTIKTDMMSFPFMHTEYWLKILGFYTTLTSALEQQSYLNSCRAVSKEYVYMCAIKAVSRERLTNSPDGPNDLAEVSGHKSSLFTFNRGPEREPFISLSLISVRAISLRIKTFC